MSDAVLHVEDGRMPASGPALSIGVPVFNGAAYLEECLASALGQGFDDIEVIVSDNASTDATGEIARDFASRDPRVSYYRHTRNLGAARNYNYTLMRARAPLFHWLAHDDRLAPHYLERCVDTLDACPQAVLCHTQVQVIDDTGAAIAAHDFPLGHAGSPDPVERLRDVLRHDRWCYEVFGVTRTDALRKAGGHGWFPGADRVLRARLALAGAYRLVPERLFHNRDHPERSVRALPAHHQRAAWFDPARASRRVYPHWRIAWEYLGAIHETSLTTSQRWRAHAELLRWLGRHANWARLAADPLLAAWPALSPHLLALSRSRERWLRS